MTERSFHTITGLTLNSRAGCIIVPSQIFPGNIPRRSYGGGRARSEAIQYVDGLTDHAGHAEIIECAQKVLTSISAACRAGANILNRRKAGMVK